MVPACSVCIQIEINPQSVERHGYVRMDSISEPLLSLLLKIKEITMLVQFMSDKSGLKTGSLGPNTLGTA